MQEEYILSHMERMMLCLRSCNAVLRWCIMHHAGTHKKLCTAVSANGPSMDTILGLALDTAGLEHEVCPLDGACCVLALIAACYWSSC